MICKKRLLCINLKLPLLLLAFHCFALMAQGQAITGTVKGEDGNPIPEVNVMVKSTTVGTVTDSEGKFSIRAGSDDILVFSFIGFVTLETPVEGQSVIDVILKEDEIQIGEVVITALGISRSTQAVQVSVAKVPGVNFTQARENNIGSSLQGWVAGVDVTEPGTGPAGPSRVIIRGYRTLGADNLPLYVVDGIPINNFLGMPVGTWGGHDLGDNLSCFNPEDIESISVLKGAAAAALYGSRGGYGVINIVTKKGPAGKGKGIGIEFNSNFVLEKVVNMSDLQKEYGAGGLANSNPADPASPRVYSKPLTQTQAFNWGTGNSWGPQFDGSQVIQFDGIERPYSYAGDNWKRFYQTGHAWTNSLALTGGNSNQAFRFSFSDLRSSYIIPNSGFNRINASLSANGKFGKKVSYSGKIMYSSEKNKNRPYVGDGANAVYTVWALPGNLNVDDLYGDPRKPGAVAPGVKTPDNKSTGEEYSPGSNRWATNPNWMAYQFKNYDSRHRVIASSNLRYNILEWLFIQGQIGMDLYEWEPSNLVPEGTSYNLAGFAEEEMYRNLETNMEWVVGLNKRFDKIGIDAFAGGNKMVGEVHDIYIYGSDFKIPFLAQVNNTQAKDPIYTYWKNGINSLYGSAEISYDDFLFITATARNDWLSALNPEHNSKIFPSLGGSLIFTEAFNISSDKFTFGKLRAAWGQVGSRMPGPYSTDFPYQLLGEGHLGLPLGIYGWGSGITNQIPSLGLSTELEAGIDLRFLGGKLGIEFTYYDQKTTGDMIQTSISPASGFTATWINAAELSNKGIELMINSSPVRGKISWDISFNLSRNWNKVIYLAKGVEEKLIQMPRTQTAGAFNIVGYPFSMLKGYVQKTDPYGNKVFDANGQPIRSDKFEILGNGIADIIGGIYNTLRWNQIVFNFLIDFKIGGEIYSGTNVRLTQMGLTKRTLKEREGGLLVEGVRQSGTGTDGKPVYVPFSMELNQEQTFNYWKNLGERDQASFVYDASFIKLRQIALGYMLPDKILNKASLSAIEISLVARNLAILYNRVDNIDPESCYNATPARGLDYFSMPSTRSYGVNLKVVF